MAGGDVEVENRRRRRGSRFEFRLRGSSFDCEFRVSTASFEFRLRVSRFDCEFRLRVFEIRLRGSRSDCEVRSAGSEYARGSEKRKRRPSPVSTARRVQGGPRICDRREGSRDTRCRVAGPGDPRGDRRVPDAGGRTAEQGTRTSAKVFHRIQQLAPRDHRGGRPGIGDRRARSSARSHDPGPRAALPEDALQTPRLKSNLESRSRISNLGSRISNLAVETRTSQSKLEPSSRISNLAVETRISNLESRTSNLAVEPRTSTPYSPIPYSRI